MRNKLSKIAYLVGIGLALALTSSCSSDSGNQSSFNNGGDGSSPSVKCSVSGFEDDEFIDPRDCKRYKYIADEGRVWMMENLNYSRNGTLGWCYKTGTNTNKLGSAGEDLEGCNSPYGRHYTYDIAMDGTTGQGLCPDGWVIPSVAEWQNAPWGVKAGYYYTDVGDPLASIWKDRTNYGYYWARNIPSGNSAGFALVGGTSIDVRSPDASNAAKTSDYFSVRCIMDQYSTPTCGGKPLDLATQRCVDSVVRAKCGSGWYDASNPNFRCQDNVVETKCGSGWYDASNANLDCQSNVIIAKCGNDWYNPSTRYCSNGTVKNYSSMTDGVQTYKTVEIGTQTWMAENLNYKTPNGTSRCYPTSGNENTSDEDNDNCVKYGRLYNWGTARTVCPSGWHLPSDEEWTTLTNSVGGSSTAGTKLKAINGWNDGGNGTDDYGFSALPGGFGYSGGFYNVGASGYWWSSTEYNASNAYGRIMSYSGANVISSGSDKSNLYSVRCVQDEA